MHTVMSAGVSGRSVLITGAGIIGLMAVTIARAAGAGTIVVSDLDDRRLDLARKLGRHPSTVLSKRLALKIPYVKPRYVWWKPEELRLLGALPDKEVERGVYWSLIGVGGNDLQSVRRVARAA